VPQPIKEEVQEEQQSEQRSEGYQTEQVIAPHDPEDYF